MELAPNTIRQLQEYCARRSSQRGFDDETAAERLIVLAEEVGEVMKAYRRSAQMHVNQTDKEPPNVGEELVDVLAMVCAVANTLGIDLETDFRAKDAAVDKRTYPRTRTLT